MSDLTNLDDCAEMAVNRTARIRPVTFADSGETGYRITNTGEVIRAALEALRESWQPIETAPKDETWVLLYGDYMGEPKVVCAFWSDGWSDGMSDPGWSESECASNTVTAFGWEPTHWALFRKPRNQTMNVTTTVTTSEIPE